jgi:hypothetical protein
MEPPRFLPKRVFQLIGVCVLAGAVSIAIQMIATSSPAVVWLADRLGGRLAAGFVVVFAALVVAIFPIALLRQFSTMPTLGEEFEQLRIHSASDFAARVLERKRDTELAGRRVRSGLASPAERRRYHRMMALGCAITAIFAAIVTLLNYIIGPEWLLVAPPVFAVIALAMVPWHLVHWWRAR